MLTKMKKNNAPSLGRPPLPEGTANTVLFAFRIAAKEDEQIANAIKRSGLTKPEWARQKLLAAAHRA
jgi:hypothetical protein